MKALVHVCLLLVTLSAASQSRKEQEKTIVRAVHVTGAFCPTSTAVDSIRSKITFLHALIPDVRGLPTSRKRRLTDIQQMEGLNKSLLCALETLPVCLDESIGGFDTITQVGSFIPGGVGTVDFAAFENQTYGTRPLRVMRDQGLLMVKGQNLALEHWKQIGVCLGESLSLAAKIQNFENNNLIKIGNQVHKDLCEVGRRQQLQTISMIVNDIHAKAAEVKVDYYRRYKKMLRDGVLP